MLRNIEIQLLIVFIIVLGVTFVETFKILAITQTVVYKSLQ
jgi:hypothetical protein